MIKINVMDLAGEEQDNDISEIIEDVCKLVIFYETDLNKNDVNVYIVNNDEIRKINKEHIMQKRQLFPEFGRASQALFVLPREIRGSQRLRYQVLEYGRSKPSSRSLLAGEQSDTIRILLLNDRKSRHRRIKKLRRYERLAATSQLSLWSNLQSRSVLA